MLQTKIYLLGHRWIHCWWHWNGQTWQDPLPPTIEHHRRASHERHGRRWRSLRSWKNVFAAGSED